MKHITISYCVCEERTFEIPTSGKWHKFFTAWEKDEDKRTNKDWDILDECSFRDFIRSQTGHQDVYDEVDIIDYD